MAHTEDTTVRYFKGYRLERGGPRFWYIDTKSIGTMGPYPTRKLAVEHAQELDAIK